MPQIQITSEVIGCYVDTFTMKPFLIASVLFGLAVQGVAVAATCERHLGLSHDVSAKHQVRLLRQLVSNGCELIAVNFSEKSQGRRIVRSQVVLDLDDETLVRVVGRGSQQRLFQWRGVSRGRLFSHQAQAGFQSFLFQGETTRRSLSDGALQLLR
jgi:hypothetical protein